MRPAITASLLCSLFFQAAPASAGERDSLVRPESIRHRLDVSAGFGSARASESRMNIGGTAEATYFRWGAWGMNGRSDWSDRKNLLQSSRSEQMKTWFGGIGAAYQFSTGNEPVRLTMDIAGGPAAGWVSWTRVPSSGSVEIYDISIYGWYLSLEPTVRMYRFFGGLYFSGMIGGGKEPVGRMGHCQRQIGMRLGVSFL
jgi:hypothetical protein